MILITRIKDKNDRCEYEQELLIRYDYDNKNDCKRHDSHIQRDYLSHQKKLKATIFGFKANEVS